MNTAREIWLDLEQKYDRGDAYRLLDLLEEFHFWKQANLSIDEYHTRLKILWDEILMLRQILVFVCNPEPACTCDVLKKAIINVNSEQVLRFVKGLNDNFEYVKSKVSMTFLY